MAATLPVTGIVCHGVGSSSALRLRPDVDDPDATFFGCLGFLFLILGGSGLEGSTSGSGGLEPFGARRRRGFVGSSSPLAGEAAAGRFIVLTQREEHWIYMTNSQ